MTRHRASAPVSVYVVVAIELAGFVLAGAFIVVKFALRAA